jgi:hypothetical protein
MHAEVYPKQIHTAFNKKIHGQMKIQQNPPLRLFRKQFLFLFCSNTDSIPEKMNPTKPDIAKFTFL